MYINVLDEPDFIGWCQVYVDGVIPDNCFAAHEEEGWIDSHLRDEAGRFQLNEDGTAVLRGRIYGSVRIHCREDAPLDICQRFIAVRNATEYPAP